MSRADVDQFLAECDDVLDDWDARQSPDAATWTADGSHEHTGPAWRAVHLGGGAVLITITADTSAYEAALARVEETAIALGGSDSNGYRVQYEWVDEATDWPADTIDQIAPPARLSRAHRRDRGSAGTGAQRSPYGPADRRTARQA